MSSIIFIISSKIIGSIETEKNLDGESEGSVSAVLIIFDLLNMAIGFYLGATYGN